MTPLKTVRKHCLMCCGYVSKEVKICDNPPGSKFECFLHPYRFGKNPSNYETLKLKTIKNYCKWCMNYPSYKLDECTSPECDLYIYRFGKNPALTGKRGFNFKARDEAKVG